MKIKLLILLALTLTVAGCNLREKMVEKQEAQKEQTEPERQLVKEKKQEGLNDSLTKNLLNKFPTAAKTDSIQFSYTYYFQDLLDESSNLLFINEAFIRDIERSKTGYYFITTYSFLPKIIGQFKIQQPLLNRLLKELKSDNLYEGCFVVRVKELKSVKTDLNLNISEFYNTSESSKVSEDDIRNNIHLDLSSGSLPSYFINGELIDYFILN